MVEGPKSTFLEIRSVCLRTFVGFQHSLGVSRSLGIALGVVTMWPPFSPLPQPVWLCDINTKGGGHLGFNDCELEPLKKISTQWYNLFYPAPALKGSSTLNLVNESF